MAPNVGAPAPEFTLKDQDQKEVKLSDYRGKKNVVLGLLSPRLEPGLHQGTRMHGQRQKTIRRTRRRSSRPQR